MENKGVAALLSVGTAIIGLAIVAVLVSNRANTGSIIGAATKGFAADLQAAEAPVTGGSTFGGGGVDYLSPQ